MWTRIVVGVLLILCTAVLAFIGLCLAALVDHVQRERRHRP